MFVSAQDGGAFRIGRVVYGLQCQSCGEETRVGLGDKSLRQLEYTRRAESFKVVVLRCASCGAEGQVTFQGDPHNLWYRLDDEDAA